MSQLEALWLLGVLELAAVGLFFYATARRVLRLGPGRPIFA
jgi:hypothetical protein